MTYLHPCYDMEPHDAFCSGGPKCYRDGWRGNVQGRSYRLRLDRHEAIVKFDCGHETVLSTSASLSVREVRNYAAGDCYECQLTVV